MSSKAQQKIDLNNLDLNCIYTFEINGQPVNLFGLDKNGKLIPMPQATINMEVFVSEIVRQLTQQKIDLNNLDLNCIYTFEINGQPVNLFGLDKNGKLIPMPQATINMEVFVSEIVRQLILMTCIIYTHQGGVVTSSQGGFNFHVRGGRMIRAPDVSFASKNVYCHLTQQQLWTLQGDPFTPMVVVEVSDTNKKKKVFDDLDEKFKFEYFATSTPTESSESESELDINCPECNEGFTERYLFMKHYEECHLHKQKHKDYKLYEFQNTFIYVIETVDSISDTNVILCNMYIISSIDQKMLVCAIAKL
ncbi:hypothetical protein Glove_341g38 [Diversispora epigaea]|uniref:C2H2-type domain-containing protein n=1 Tax=Diversispora epigaea TaxID=1348612 RepID=A0A397HLL4_9GLOM|nr:hypothetical protein Glove_341g38 [Diversispora epigaea]